MSFPLRALDEQLSDKKVYRLEETFNSQSHPLRRPEKFLIANNFCRLRKDKLLLLSPSLVILKNFFSIVHALASNRERMKVFHLLR